MKFGSIYSVEVLLLLYLSFKWIATVFCPAHYSGKASCLLIERPSSGCLPSRQKCQLVGSRRCRKAETKIALLADSILNIPAK